MLPDKDNIIGRDNWEEIKKKLEEDYRDKWKQHQEVKQQPELTHWKKPEPDFEGLKKMIIGEKYTFEQILHILNLYEVEKESITDLKEWLKEKLKVV